MPNELSQIIPYWAGCSTVLARYSTAQYIDKSRPCYILSAVRE